jgi:hypothetical protein
MIGFGIPINEFSFGNTLISGGVTSFMGGLVIVGLAAVVAQLQRVVEALAVRPPMRATRPFEPFAQAVARAEPASKIPFPPKPKSEASEPHPVEIHSEVAPQLPPQAKEDDLTVVPTLRNPDEAQLAVEESDEFPLPPRQTVREPIGMDGSKGTEKRQEAAFDTGWRAPRSPPRTPQSAFFDTMWPASAPRQPKPAVVEAKSEPKPEARFESRYEPKSEFRPAPKPEAKVEAKAEPIPEPPIPEPVAPAPASLEPEMEKPPANEMRAVAILKSGVVDGMGYTLYVDGSIEAELPQGTLRFASINELRSHLEKNS